MKSEPIRLNLIPKQNFSLKRFFSNSRVRIKTLLSDIFEKNPETKRLVSRGLPNSVGAENEVYNAKFSKTEFFPEDIEKMANMSKEEAKDYRIKLIIEKKYIRQPYD